MGALGRTPSLAAALAVPLLAAAGTASAQRPLPAVDRAVSPPAAIAGLDAFPVTPLEFSRAWLTRAEEVRRRRAELTATGELDGMEPAAAARAGAALAGTLRVPVIPVRYAGVPEPFPVSVLEERLFGAGQGDTVSFAGYWEEVSGGLLRVEGEVLPWVELRRPARHYLPSEQYGWSRFGRIGEVWTEVVRAAERHLDLGRFDNDGPDGIPNSGDDDGYVDFAIIVYATDCRGDWRAGSIWPHRGAMPPVATRQRRTGGGRIKLADYVILPAIEPGTCDPMHIGVLAHETGHALGLPDLYDYDGTSQGIGAWGLMGLGSQSSSFSPAHLSAWSKEQLGWVRVDWIEADTAGLEIPPVAEDRRVFRHDLPGRRGEYLLLENRQPLGSDGHLPGHGLLVWRVDPQQGELGAWNTDERRAAVALIDADGQGKLRRGLPADGGDPFPGTSGRTRLTVDGTRPITLADIRSSGRSIVADVYVGHTAPALVAAPAAVRFSALAYQQPAEQRVSVRPVAGAGRRWSAAGGAAPWLHATREGDDLVIRVDPGGMPPGVYRDTIRLVADVGGGEGESWVPANGRVPVELSVAAPGLREVIASRLPWSWGLAAAGGRLVKASYAWDPLGLRPMPRLLQIGAGEKHPETLARLPADALYAPVPAEHGAVYVLARAGGENYLYRVEQDGRARAVASRFGDAPAYGLALLPDHSLLVAEWSGRLHRVTSDGAVSAWGELGVNVYQLAADRAGHLFAATYGGDVLWVDPTGASRFLATGFRQGRLVAVAAGGDGTVFAAERGGEGRIVRFDADGRRQVVARVPGANFYGIAVEGGFVYALDLAGRQLHRIGLVPAGDPRAAN